MEKSKDTIAKLLNNETIVYEFNGLRRYLRIYQCLVVLSLFIYPHQGQSPEQEEKAYTYY